MADAEAEVTDVITVECDGNPDIDDAADLVKEFMAAGKVTGLADSSSAMGRPSLTVYVLPQWRKELVEQLTEKKFRIVEGGQL